MKSLLAYFLDRPLLVNIIVTGLIVSGWMSATDIQREGLPAIPLNMVFVTAQLPGASALDIESKVALPLEEALEKQDGVDRFTTTITDHRVSILVRVDPDYGTEKLRRFEAELRRDIDAIDDLPADVEGPWITVADPGTFPAIEIALSGPEDALQDAAHQLEGVLRPLPTVRKAELVGLADPEIRVLFDPVRAEQLGVALTDVMGAIAQRHVLATGGVLQRQSERQQVVLDARLTRIDEVADVVVRAGPDGSVLRVRDVARVELDREERLLRVHTNGRPGISVIVQKRSSADLLDTVEQVRAKVTETKLPEGVRVEIVNDASQEARNRLRVMFYNGVIGVVLIIVLLFAFLTPRAAFWVMAGVPVVGAAVITLLPLLGMTINVVSLAGMVLVLGMLVDDAVVVAERIVFRQQGSTDPRAGALHGTMEMARPVIASAITTMLAFVPLLALGGDPGKFAWYIPAVVVLSLLLSVLECLLILPAHMRGRGDRRERRAEKRRFVLWLEARYARLLAAAVAYRYGVLALFVSMLLGAVFIIGPRLSFVLFPQEDSDALYVRVTVPPGTPIEVTEARTAAIEEQLRELLAPDIQTVTARVGHQDPDAMLRTQGASESEAIIFALFHHGERLRTSAGWAERLAEQLWVPEDTRVSYEARRIGPPLGWPVMIHVKGNDDAERRAVAAEIASILRGMTGLVDVELDEREGLRQLDLHPDYERLAMRGISAETLSTVLKVAFHGAQVAEHRDLDTTTTIRVMFEQSARGSIDALLDTPLRNERGELVRIRDVVHPREIASVSPIYHRDGQRCATVTAAFSPRSKWTAQSFAKGPGHELISRYSDAAVRVFQGGEAEETSKTTKSLGKVALLAFGGICVVIALMLGSFLEAAFVMMAVPFGVVGVLVAFFVHGESLSLFAILGLIGMAGVVVNTCIVMVDAIHLRLREAPLASREARRRAMIEAVVERLRPVLVTSVTTLGGVFPTAYGWGGRDSVLSPMSLALGWGLLFSTVVTLFLLPVLYTISGDVRRLFGKRSHGSLPERELAPEREGEPRARDEPLRGV